MTMPGDERHKERPAARQRLGVRQLSGALNSDVERRDGRAKTEAPLNSAPSTQLGYGVTGSGRLRSRPSPVGMQCL